MNDKDKIITKGGNLVIKLVGKVWPKNPFIVPEVKKLWESKDYEKMGIFVADYGAKSIMEALDDIVCVENPDYIERKLKSKKHKYNVFDLAQFLQEMKPLASAMILNEWKKSFDNKTNNVPDKPPPFVGLNLMKDIKKSSQILLTWMDIDSSVCELFKSLPISKILAYLSEVPPGAVGKLLSKFSDDEKINILYELNEFEYEKQKEDRTKLSSVPIHPKVKSILIEMKLADARSTKDKFVKMWKEKYEESSLERIHKTEGAMTTVKESVLNMSRNEKIDDIKKLCPNAKFNENKFTDDELTLLLTSIYNKIAQGVVSLPLTEKDFEKLLTELESSHEKKSSIEGK